MCGVVGVLFILKLVLDGCDHGYSDSVNYSNKAPHAEENQQIDSVGLVAMSEKYNVQRPRNGNNDGVEHFQLRPEEVEPKCVQLEQQFDNEQ